MNNLLYFALFSLSLLKAPYNWVRNFPRLWRRGTLRALSFEEFVDPRKPDKVHSVLVFPMPPGMSLDTHFRNDLLGPFGFESQLPRMLDDLHIYGLDEWGALSDVDMVENFVELNPELDQLLDDLPPGYTLQLAGVRRGPFKRPPWPLCNPRSFRLVRK